MQATCAAATRAGDPSLADTVCGPMIDARQADRVTAWVAEAAGRGARVFGGGREGNVVSPCVLEQVPGDARVARDEAFGEAQGNGPVVEGRLVSWNDVGRTFVMIGVGWSGVLLVLGYLSFRRKELAIYSGQGG